jgi:hypothetical protein
MLTENASERRGGEGARSSICINHHPPRLTATCSMHIAHVAEETGGEFDRAAMYASILVLVAKAREVQFFSSETCARSPGSRVAGKVYSLNCIHSCKIFTRPVPWGPPNCTDFCRLFLDRKPVSRSSLWTSDGLQEKCFHLRFEWTSYYSVMWCPKKRPEGGNPFVESVRL